MSETRTGFDKTDDEHLFCGLAGSSRPRGGEVSTEVGLKERNDDAEVLSCSQNGLTQIRFD